MGVKRPKRHLYYPRHSYLYYHVCIECYVTSVTGNSRDSVNCYSFYLCVSRDNRNVDDFNKKKSGLTKQMLAPVSYRILTSIPSTLVLTIN